MSLSNYAENKALDHILKVAAFVVPTNLYVALSTANPGEDAATINEPVGGNYARKLWNTWKAAVNRSSSNNGQIQFNQASAAWGIVTHFAVFDAVTAGNMLFYGALTTSKNIVAGNIPTFNDGEIVITGNTGAWTNYLVNKILDHILKVAAFIVPTNLYVGWSTANPGDDASGLAEPVGNNYARVLHNNWAVAAAGASYNVGQIQSPSATGSWGIITHHFIADALTLGNVLMYGPIDVAQEVQVDDYILYDENALDITLD